MYISDFVLVFHCSPKARTAASIILRGANDFMLDEVERSLHDALCVVKRVMECNQIVAGGGAVEAALSIYLENFATSLVRIIYQWMIRYPNALSWPCRVPGNSWLLESLQRPCW